MTARRRVGHEWRPISDLPADWRELHSTELHSLLSLWDSEKSKLVDTEAFADFQARTIREWSIETGILERIYTLDEGITITLIEQGFDASLISGSDTDIPPDELILILEDHREAAEGLFSFIRQNRPLSTSYIKELHQVLTRHQDTCEAIDGLGRRVRATLEKGSYKRLPNNPGDPATGEIRHEYCPPEHVAAEMDRLIEMHRQHDEIPYEIEAAWLHHRFTQIHPFQDGNGRVARALATLVCLRGGGFPLLVKRDDKSEYILALELADDGDLAPLVALFRGLQKDRFVSALSISRQIVDHRKSLEAIVQDAKQRLEGALSGRRSIVQARVQRLVELAYDRFSELASVLTKEIESGGVDVRAFQSDASNAYFFRGQIIEIARRFKYYANLSGLNHWARLRIKHSSVTSDLVISIHHLGQVSDSIMVASAFLSQRSPERGDVEDDSTPPYVTQPACDDVFTITAGRDESELERSFSDWLERCLRIGLDTWRRSL